jgi:predicted enzyme related to lactoylglutathione lyase
MPNIDHHPPGDFTWIELATTDQAAAKNFYGALFGWTPNDMPMGPSEFYTIFRINERDVAAGYTMRADERAQGIPPHWGLYIAVENADESAAKAAHLGGKVLMPAFDVMEAGRMAVIEDPTGAIFCVWQAKKNQGVGVTREPGTLCWADLNTSHPDRAGVFYADLLGWNISHAENDNSGYLHIKNGHDFIGGIPPGTHRPPGVPPHWMIYFAVADVDATAAKAAELGAATQLAPMTMEGVGRMAVLSDPQGASFAIFKGSM